MKKYTTHSKTGLFLMEMILVLLFLSLSCAACIRILAAARENRIRTEEWIHIQALTTSAGEIMEGTDGSDQSFLSAFPGGTSRDQVLTWYYDSGWEPCTEKEAARKMELTLASTALEKKGTLSFSRMYGTDRDIYSVDLAFPVTSTDRREGTS